MARSKAASAAITDSALTLGKPLILAEFDTDHDTDVLERLHQAITDGRADNLPYFAERIRQDHTRRAATTTVAAEWEAAGVRVVRDETDSKYLTNLTDIAGEVTEISDRSAVTAETHEGFPLWAPLQVENRL